MNFIRTTLAATALAGFSGMALAQPAAVAPQPVPVSSAENPAPAAATTTTRNSSAAAPTRATATDLVVGASVMGPDGQRAGTIETADASGATVSTGTARGRLALDAFYKNDAGLMIGYTAAQLNQMGTPVTAAAATPAPADAATPQN